MIKNPIKKYLPTSKFKVSIIGCGSVGSATAYAYVLSGSVTNLSLFDIDKGKAEGLMLDISHATAFTPYVEMEASDKFSVCKNSNLIVVTAGARQQEGETRLDLIEKNRKIFQSIIPKIAKVAPDAIILIVSNPVDVLTYETIKLKKFPENHVFGSGTVLDSIRLKYHVSEKINVHPSSIDAYILGEHGDSSFPFYSSANVLGKPLSSWEGFNKKTAEQAYQDTKDAAYRIINDQGYTCYSIATVIREITECIFKDKKQVFTLSVPIENYYGNSDVCLSVPCVLGKNGIEKIIKVPLSQEEQKSLRKSAKTLKALL
jgi:L-lactate dehydrogenase